MKAGLVAEALLAETVCRLYGHQKTLVVEPEDGRLLQGLRQNGLVATPGAIAPRSNDIVTLDGRPVDGAFGLVVLNRVLDGGDVSATSRILKCLYNVTSRYALLIVDNHTVNDIANDTAHKFVIRRDWEAVCFQMGFRKFSGYYAFNKYSSLQSECGSLIIPLEKIKPRALLQYTLTILRDERDLHMDMMRESGSRSDAHIIRYVIAAQHIRPGDRVLDAACGLGYGAHVLSQLSRADHVRGIDASPFSIDYANLIYGQYNNVDFHLGHLPECLEDIPDNYYDVVVSFETLEHIAETPPVLEAFHRILTPGGRIIASVPNDWSDETGMDPNPHHLQVYTLQKFVSDLSSYFKIETLLRQVADRVKKPGGAPGEFEASPRAIAAIPLDEPEQPIEAEWLLAVASKDLASGERLIYVDRAHNEEERRSAGAALAIAEHYDNPWIVRTLVSIGNRIYNPNIRRELASEILASARSGSADEGACLCVLAYLHLETSAASSDQTPIDLIDNYIGRTATENLTVLRWQVSLAYVRALLAVQAGDAATAEFFFLKVLAMRSSNFGVTLLTKPADAAFRLGCLYLSQNKPDRTRELWLQSYKALRSDLAAYHANATDAISPSFELNEISEIFSRLSRLAGGLKALDQTSDRPFAVALETQGDALSHRSHLVRQIDELKQNREHLIQEIRLMAAIGDEKDDWSRQLTEARDYLFTQLKAANESIEQIRNVMAEQGAWIKDLSEGKAWLEDQWKRAVAVIEEKDSLIAELRAEITGK